MSVRRRVSGRAHYNYFRDYDPAVGRYDESDPIGLGGGINTFSYVAAQPVNFLDALGLDKFIFFDPKDPDDKIQNQGSLADDDDPNVCKVYAHGNWGVVSDRRDGKDRKRLLTPKQLNDYLNSHGCKGKRVELYSCSTGANGPNGELSFAERLSKLPGRNGVMAPDKSAVYTEDGPTSNSYGHKNNDVHQPLNHNDRGTYREF